MPNKPDASEPTIFGEGFGEKHEVRPVPAPGEVCPEGDMAVMPEHARTEEPAYLRAFKRRGAQARADRRDSIVKGDIVRGGRGE
jgi:hypothetical protein